MSQGALIRHPGFVAGYFVTAGIFYFLYFMQHATCRRSKSIKASDLAAGSKQRVKYAFFF